MKKLIATLSYAILVGNVLLAQNTIKLNINHKLGNTPFALNQSATNNLGHTFNLNRMQYYMSGFSITHDGGQTTTLTSVYALVDASAPAQIDLGNFPSINNVEAIKFSIGVIAPENNQDPTLWPSNHPLSPKSPSMHWGWSSGYFFVALGGNSSPALNQSLELHALGNSNYFSQTISTSASIVGNDKIISINADYEQALKNITISSGLVLHGSSGANVTLLNNFKNFVFTPVNLSVGLKEDKENYESISVFPNPSLSGKFNLPKSLINDSFSYKIFDVAGKLVQNGKISSEQLEIKNSGVYILLILKDDLTIARQKLIVE